MHGHVQAAKQGRWLAVEGIEMAHPDVLAALVPLMESRQLQLPQQAQTITAADDFQIIATITTAPRELPLTITGNNSRKLMPMQVTILSCSGCLANKRTWQVQTSFACPSSACIHYTSSIL